MTTVKVDELHFYQSLNPEKTIVTITTQEGQDATAVVDLRNSVHEARHFKQMYP